MPPAKGPRSSCAHRSRSRVAPGRQWALGGVLLVIGLGFAGSVAAAGATTPTGPVVKVTSVVADPRGLPATGGRIVVTGAVENATSCQLNVVSSQLSVSYPHGPTPACHGGNYSEPVTIGANPTAVGQTVAFALVARNRTSSAVITTGSGPPVTVTGVTGTTVVIIKTSCDVVAQLIGGGNFQIDPSGPREESFYGTGQVAWTWYVTPEVQGRDLQLTLVINSLYYAGTTTHVVSTRNALVTISVYAAPKSVLAEVGDVSENPIFVTVAGAAIVGGFTVIFRWFRKTRARSATEAATTTDGAPHEGLEATPRRDEAPPS